MKYGSGIIGCEPIRNIDQQPFEKNSGRMRTSGGASLMGRATVGRVPNVVLQPLLGQATPH